MSKVLEKIRAVIYNVDEGRLTKEESMDKVMEIMNKHYSEKLKKRI